LSEQHGKMHVCRKLSWPQHREADNGCWSGYDVITFRIEVFVGRIGRWVCNIQLTIGLQHRSILADALVDGALVGFHT